MAVSMADVARHAGVSQRTVSNVVNNYVHVSAATRSRVEASLKELGYRPNVAARQLRRGRTGTITLAVPGFRERYFADLVDAVISRAASLDLRVLVETTGGDHSRERSLLAGGGDLLTDGVIMSAVTLGPADITAARYPLVLVGDYEPHGPVDHVGIPNRKAARAAVAHLISTGRRRIALLGRIPHPTYSYKQRYLGYRDALRAGGITYDPGLLIDAAWSFDGGGTAVSRLVDCGSAMPDGIFGLNDSVALGAVDALVRRGFRVAYDISVIGFDDIIEAGHARPTLSSISPRLDDIAKNALDLLGEQFSSDRPARRRHVGFELHVRESSTRP